MLSDISISGVLFPRLLVTALAALVLTALSSRVMAGLGLYRLFAYPPLVNGSLFSIWLGLSMWLMYEN
jgi:hypothetical protein